MEEDDIIYQQEQVVWAKIRGYPWWPAFVSQIQQVNGKEQIYVVVFFGDNTKQNMLDSSKLRKFIDNYTECYSKAKNQRKLMNSIMMAQQKLRQNDQNVEIFEQFRNKIKGKKGKSKSKQNYEQLSNISEQGQPVRSKKSNQNQIYQEIQQSIINSKNQDKSHSKPLSKQKNSGRKGRKNAKIQQDPVFESKDSNGEQMEKSEIKLRDRRRSRRQPIQKNNIAIMREVDIVIDLTKKMNSEEKEQRSGFESSQKIRQQIYVESEKQQSNQVKQDQPAESNCNDRGQLLKNKRGNRRSSKKKSDRKRNILNQQNLEENTVSKNQIKIEKEKINIQQLVTPSKQPQIPLPVQLIKQATQPIPKQDKNELIEMDVEQPQEQAEESQSLSSEIVVVKRRGRSVSTGHPIASIRPVVHPRKRGRPKKIDIAKQVQQEQQSQRENKAENVNMVTGHKTKFIRKSFAPLKQPQVPKGMSMADQAVINGVKKLLHNRNSLIEFLGNAVINVDNVKQILDMDVSNILQEGLITQQVIHLLQIFRAALLYKYFPDDVKHRKKYEKLMKKKFVVAREVERVKSNEKPELRKKTMLKIKKFIANENDSQSKIKDVSHKIEELIYHTDQTLGNQYCKIAFQVLTALKEKSQTYQQIMRKLECKIYE